MILTKSYYLNETTEIARSQPLFVDKGYSLDIPVGDVVTAGWQFKKPNTWGKENVLITRPDPEFYAPYNTIRSNGLPQINPHDKIYAFDRSKYTYKLF